MSELGYIASYALAIKQTQMSLIKSAVEMQQKTVEILLGDDTSRVAPSDMIGCNVDVRL